VFASIHLQHPVCHNTSLKSQNYPSSKICCGQNQFISLSYILSTARKFSGTKIIINCETVIFVRQLTQCTNVKTRATRRQSIDSSSTTCLTATPSYTQRCNTKRYTNIGLLFHGFRVTAWQRRPLFQKQNVACLTSGCITGKQTPGAVRLASSPYFIRRCECRASLRLYRKQQSLEVPRC